MKLKLNGLEKLPALLNRFKYPAAILLLGVVLLLWPSSGKEKTTAVDPVPEETMNSSDEGADYCKKMEQKLEILLCQVAGAGRVRVLLTLKTGPATYYQSDVSRNQRREGDSADLSEEEKTVILSRGNAYDEPAVVSTAYPVFQGALIIADGGADPSVRLQLSAAVAALLDLGADQITVVKMK